MTRHRDHGTIDVSDDLRWADNTAAGAALNDAIVRARDLGRRVVMTGGPKDIEVPIEYFTGTCIEGQGVDETVLTFTGAGPMFRNGQGSRVYRARFEHFWCVNGGGGTVGFDWDSVSISKMEFVQFNEFPIGIDLHGAASAAAGGTESASLYNRFEGLDCRLGGTGVLLRSQSNTNQFFAPVFLANVKGMEITKANNVTVWGGTFEANTGHGLLLDAPVPNFNRMNSFHGNRFEFNGAGAWEITNANTIRTTFHGNFYDGNLAIDNGLATQRFEVPLGFWSKQGYASQPIVTGSRSGNQALNVLVAVLDNYGLIDNQTTA